MVRNQGYFITFEGGEGSGKSTQIKRLAETLTNSGYTILQTREPGGTPEAEKIRDLLVQRDGGAWNPFEECLLFSAARHNHVETLIKPALQKGKIILCDRFSDSTLAYQGYGLGVDIQTLKQLDRLVLGDFKPDITFLLDIDPEMGLERSERRFIEAEKDSKERTEDRYERMDFTFHKKIRAGFLDLAEQEPERCHVLSATLPIDELAEKIKTRTLEALG